MNSFANSAFGAAFAAAALAACPSIAHADDYTLAAGDSATFDNGVTNSYGTVNISGDLTVSGNTWLIGTSSTAAALSGGTVTVEGGKSVFGAPSSGNSDGKDMSLNPGSDGKYTKITVRNGKNEAVSGRYYNVGAKCLNIGADTAESLAQYPDGVFHFLDIDGAGANFHKLINNSSLTGRVTIAGNSQFGTADGYWGGFFNKGNFLVEVAESATHKFNAGNQLRSYNEAGCNVKETGSGNLVFYHVLNTGATLTKMAINRGAVLDVTGTLTFDTLSWGGSVGWYAINDSNVFGPNVGKIKSGSTANYSTVFDVGKGVEIVVHDFELKRAKDMVVGSGAIRVDASAASRKFEAVIPASYTFGSTYENKITIAKSGAFDAEIVATNFPALRVDEGTVRLTTDCVVHSLQGASGAKVVADGCTVTIASGRHVPNGLELATANGGKFVKADVGTAYMYGSSVLGTDLHVAEGSVVFSAYGLTQKYFRWTFTKTSPDPSPLWLGRLWIFDNEGGHATTGMRYASTPNSTASLAANNACWEYSSATNMVLVSGTPNWQALDRLHFVVGIDDLTANMNNFAKLESPVVDSDNPDSWLGIGMRLADDAKPVTGYNVMSEDTTKYPVSWKVEASDDGTTWNEIETRTDVVHAKPGYCTFYDGTYYADLSEAGKPIEYFHFSGYKRNGLEADAAKAVSLQVDYGASVDFTAFTVAPQKIGGLTLDMAVGGGTIRGGSITESGALYVNNSAQGFVRDSPLSLALDGIANADNLKGWTVYIDGDAKANWRAKVIDGHVVVCSPGFEILIR